MISEIQTINRFLASVNALETDIGAKEVDVAEYYTTQYVYPVRDAFIIAKEFCIKTVLIEYRKNQLNLSDLGKTYLSLNSKTEKAFILEPNRKQKDFLSINVFLISEKLDLVKKILYNFSRSSNGELWLSKEKAAALEDQNFLNLLLQLEILIDKKDVIELSHQYIDFLETVVSETVTVITPDALEKSEAEKKEISKISEEYVLKNESSRLISTNAAKQSKNINHVALKNVAAGYDIASFDGKDSQNHDRFIEVKAGKRTPIRFFLSRNEFETAKRLKGRYYVYYVCMEDKKPRELYIFSDPTQGIMKDPKFIISTDTYEISEK